MATIVPFHQEKFACDLLISSFAPLLWLALVQAQQIDDGRPSSIAVRWLKELAEDVGPLLRDSDPETIRRAQLVAELALSLMRQQYVPGRTS